MLRLVSCILPTVSSGRQQWALPQAVTIWAGQGRPETDLNSMGAVIANLLAGIGSTGGRGLAATLSLIGCGHALTHNPRLYPGRLRGLILAQSRPRVAARSRGGSACDGLALPR
jgi:hypothetical protein